ncbi:MAG: hypothetical protein J4224_04910 [Candidatus Diapherotrites archaeon]|uniref:Uncharacterized protein n=1 Tax=Candidatus Iainarchaeum sp. TaxID=3101447 RepID=A0A8T4KXL4_9ARCH|nr:hypothetical protein [Candidatus Diapherotrites archaeon]
MPMVMLHKPKEKRPKPTRKKERKEKLFRKRENKRMAKTPKSFRPTKDLHTLLIKGIHSSNPSTKQFCQSFMDLYNRYKFISEFEDRLMRTTKYNGAIYAPQLVIFLQILSSEILRTPGKIYRRVAETKSKFIPQLFGGTDFTPAQAMDFRLTLKPEYSTTEAVREFKKFLNRQ